MLKIRVRPKTKEEIHQIPKNEELSMKGVFQKGYVVDTFKIKPCEHNPSNILFIIKMHRVGFPLEIIDQGN
jgi:hypothetical protein